MDMKFIIKDIKVASLSVSGFFLNEQQKIDDEAEFIVHTWLLAPHNYGIDTLFTAEIVIEIKMNTFQLSLHHFFELEFEEKLEKSKWNSEELKKEFLLRLYPHTRAFLMSFLSLSGQGSFNLPTEINL